MPKSIVNQNTLDPTTSIRS